MDARLFADDDLDFCVNLWNALAGTPGHCMLACKPMTVERFRSRLAIPGTRVVVVPGTAWAQYRNSGEVMVMAVRLDGDGAALAIAEWIVRECGHATAAFDASGVDTASLLRRIGCSVELVDGRFRCERGA